jgi:hypothetical protein
VGEPVRRALENAGRGLVESVGGGGLCFDLEGVDAVRARENRDGIFLLQVTTPARQVSIRALKTRRRTHRSLSFLSSLLPSRSSLIVFPNPSL